MKLRWPLLLSLGLLVAVAACETDSNTAAPIAPAELAKQIEQGSAPLILDVRSEEEYAAGHIVGAVNIPHDQLGGRLAELPSSKTTEIVVHCERGRRAGVAEGVLAEAGYTNVRDLQGHMQAWLSAGLPVQ